MNAVSPTPTSSPPNSELSRRDGWNIGAVVLAALLISYAVEGMFAALIGWLGWTAIQKGSRNWALAATLAWAVGGAIRPTTTAFLFPLWLYIVFRSDRRYAVLAIHVLIALPIVFAWNSANHYYRAALFGFDPPPVTGIEEQALLSGGYDPATFSAQAQRNAATLAYHWPAVEVIAWSENHTGVHLLHRSVTWPVPSLRHAAAQTAVNVAKCGYFLLLSLPLLLAGPLFWIHRREGIFPTGTILFGTIWIVPALCYDTFGHFGSSGYLLLLLPIFCVLIVGAAIRLLIERPAPLPVRSVLAALLMASPVVALIWCFARPVGLRHEYANLLLLQYTGHAVVEGFGLNRQSIALSPTGMFDERYRDCRTDAQLLAQLRKDNPYPRCAIPFPASGEDR